jgi:hypothetical protein
MTHKPLVILCLAAGVALSSCEEDFPPYTEPANVLNVEVEAVNADTVEMYFDGLTGQYFINTPMILNVRVINTHDDLLEGEALIDGLMTIQSFSEIPRTMTVPLGTGDLRTPPVFQGNIAIAPDSAAEFSTLWLPIAADGKVVYDGLPFVQVGGSRVFGPIEFMVSVDVQVFERVQAIRAEGFAFSQIFREFTP